MTPKALRHHHLQRLKHKRKYDRNYHSHLTYTTTGETIQIIPMPPRYARPLVISVNAN